MYDSIGGAADRKGGSKFLCIWSSTVHFEERDGGASPQA
jgi:hypothetical protein